MLVDVNLLLYAANRAAPEHVRARQWLEERLNGSARVGLPWESLVGFVRLATSPRVLANPMTPSQAWEVVDDWLEAPAAWVPVPTGDHAGVFGALVTKYRPTGNLVPDAHLAALAIEHGLEVCSSDTDFARFSEIRWVNPLAA